MALLDDEDMEDIRKAFKLKVEYDDQKRERIRRDEYLKQDLEARRKRLEDEVGIERLKKLEGLSAEVLMMAAKDPELQKQYYNLSLKKVLGQFTPDRIAALRLGENPELDNTLKDIILRMKESGNLEQYEKLIKELKETRTEQKEVYDHNIQALVQMFNQALGTARDIATGG